MKMTLNEEIELLRCGNWFDKLRDVIPSDEYLDLGWAIGDVLDTLEQLQAENEKLKAQVPRWIPVEERLPMPDENPVLVYDYSSVGMAWYSSTMGWMYRTGLGCLDITHWMPLPKAPKEVTHEK